MMTGNAQIARLLREYSALLTVSGADRFKAGAYRRAAESVESMNTDMETFVSEGHSPQELPGVGKAIGPAIEEIIQTGHLPRLDRLSSALDPSLTELATRPSLNPQQVTRIYKKLNINSLSELKDKLQAGGIREQFGSRLDFQIRQGLSDRPGMLFKRAQEVGAKIEAFLKSMPEVTRVELTGSLRRKVETIGDISLLFASRDPQHCFEAFNQFGAVESHRQLDLERAVYRLSSGPEVTLTWTPARTFGWKWMLTTGSEAHLADLQREARALNINWTVDGLSSKHVDLTRESAIYDALGMQYVEPELREGQGEVPVAQQLQLPRLVRLADIKGDLHMHTTASDGLNTIAEMTAVALEKGYRYIAITDHSRSLRIANGLNESQLQKHIAQIKDFNARTRGITVLKSAEVDILEDGSLDYPDSLLKELDLTVCSIHSRFALDKQQQTTRILRAMDNPYFNILGHATGRLLLKRPGYEIDLEKVLRHARQNGCFLEINSNPNRLDLSDEHARLAKDAGIKIAINTDAHSIRELDFMPFGINQARRAWLTDDNVLNTMSLTRLKRALKRT